MQQRVWRCGACPWIENSWFREHAREIGLDALESFSHQGA
jgi:hypothetical protein